MRTDELAVRMLVSPPRALDQLRLAAGHIWVDLTHAHENLDPARAANSSLADR